ncbi:MAG TPA: peptidoglycan-associated lipoprotein Pal [Alphaproteobacteria bacterium]
MRTKLIALAGVLLLVAACETTPEETGEAGAAGVGAAPQAAPTTTAPPEQVEAMAAPRELTPQEQLVQEVGDRVFFDFDRYSLRPDGQATLRRQAEFLLAHPNLSITLSGHCDERGTREYNLALGERRANAAKDYLNSLGVEEDRITTISYGKERPIVLGHNESAWAQNRVGVSSIN